MIFWGLLGTYRVKSKHLSRIAFNYDLANINMSLDQHEQYEEKA